MGSLRDLAARLRAHGAERAETTAGLATNTAEAVASEPPPSMTMSSGAAPLEAHNAKAVPAAADRETAARLDEAMRGGATCAWCSTGALDVVLPDGRLWFLAPTKAARMRAAGLLPVAIPGAKR